MKRRDFLTSAVVAPFGGVAKARPNILLITTDQQSADAMSCRIGNRYLKTPAINSLASQGTLYTRAYAANPICIPSRTSMYTGRYPSETGIQMNEGTQLDPGRFPCMGTIFRDAGYETAYTGKWHLPYNPKEGRHGFRVLEGKKGGYRDDAPMEAAIDFLKKTPKSPFLLVTSFLNPHNICEWPRREALDCGPIGDPPPVKQRPPRRLNFAPQKDEPDIIGLMRKSYQSNRLFPVGGFGESEWRLYIWAYYRMVEKVDSQIGRVLQAGRDSGQENNTLVVFLSDHGDSQGAHGWNQKTVFYEESVRVPFILSHKGVTRKATSDRLINTGVDLIPTLCSHVGIPAPASLPGLSATSTARREFIVVSNRFAQGLKEHPRPDGRMIHSGRYKYCIHNEGVNRESLVDLEKDPGEMVNLARQASHASILAEHRKMLAGWCGKFGDKFPVAT